MPAGIAPSDITVGDVNGDGLPDIIVTDQASGDVTVLLNDPAHSFSQSLRFRASTGFYGLSTTVRQSGRQLVRRDRSAWSRATSPGTAATISWSSIKTTHSFTVLAADGTGGFANPSPALTTSTSDGSSINNRPARSWPATSTATATSTWPY